jgi:hypothetical protein
MRRFEAGLDRKRHGFVARLVSDDPIARIPKPEGDEIPEHLPEPRLCVGFSRPEIYWE